MEWIKCSDRFPEIYDFVLVFANNKGAGEPRPISIARWNSQRWEFINNDNIMPNYGAWSDIEYPIDSDHVTHWMKLPRFPEK